MKKLAILILFLALTALPCLAVKEIQNGSFVDPSGTAVASGTIIFQLSQAAKVIASGQVAPRAVMYALNATGDIDNSSGTQNILANDELTPTNTHYLVTVIDSNGNPVFGPERWILEGASPIDLDGMTPTLVDPSFADPVLLNPAGDQTIQNFDLNVVTLNNVRKADQFAGANAGVKIAACIADLPSTGGICDARGFEGAQTIASLALNKPMTLLLGYADYTVTGNITVTENDVAIIGAGDSSTATGTRFNFSGGSGVAVDVNRTTTSTQDFRMSDIHITFDSGYTHGVRLTTAFRPRLERIFVDGSSSAGQIGFEFRDDETAGSMIYLIGEQLEAIEVATPFRFNKASTTKAVSNNTLIQPLGGVAIASGVGIDFEVTGSSTLAHNTIIDPNITLDGNSAIGIRVRNNVQQLRIVGGLIEEGSTGGTTTVGLQTDAGSSGTLAWGGSYNGTDTALTANSTTNDNVYCISRTAVQPILCQFDRVFLNANTSGFLSGDANRVFLRAGGAFGNNGVLESADATVALSWSNSAVNIVGPPLWIGGTSGVPFINYDTNQLVIQAEGAFAQNGRLLDEAGASALTWGTANVQVPKEFNPTGDINHDGTNVGFFSVAPVARPGATDDIKDALTNLGLLQGTSATPLNLDGGALTAATVAGTTSVTIGGGTAITGHLSASDSTVNLDLSAGGITCATDTITVTGAATGDVVALGLPTTMAGESVKGWVSSTNTVTVEACDVDSGGTNHANITIRADVWQH